MKLQLVVSTFVVVIAFVNAQNAPTNRAERAGRIARLRQNIQEDRNTISNLQANITTLQNNIIPPLSTQLSNLRQQAEGIQNNIITIRQAIALRRREIDRLRGQKERFRGFIRGHQQSIQQLRQLTLDE